MQPRITNQLGLLPSSDLHGAVLGSSLAAATSLPVSNRAARFPGTPSALRQSLERSTRQRIEAPLPDSFVRPRPLERSMHRPRPRTLRANPFPEAGIHPAELRLRRLLFLLSGENARN